VPVDLDNTVREVLADSDSMIRETEAVVNAGPLPTVTGEPTQLRQLFQNLITNAIKFRRRDVPPVVDVTASDGGSLWTFVVTDNGVGVEPEHREHIFGMFSRVHHGDRPGSGIGLAICSRVVANHGGTIWVADHDAPGSHFAFTLAKDL
jgi:signal transduction histidine kinase